MKMKILKLASITLYILAVITLVAGVFFSTPVSVYADTTKIEWKGNGSENLPCAYGAHWVLAPAQGITGATLQVNGVYYEMAQNGNGSWWANSKGLLETGLSASVEYLGVNNKAHLQLSHCIDDPNTVTPTETVTETPTETETPTLTETITETPTLTETVTETSTLTETVTETPTETVTETPTETSTPTLTETVTETPTETETPEVTEMQVYSLIPVTGSDNGNLRFNSFFYVALILTGFGLMFGAFSKEYAHK